MKVQKNQWRKKPPENFQQLVDQTQQLRLYLINQAGPTSFLYADDNGGRFKVTIGEIISCSCQIVSHGHCVHSLHAILKKFKVDPTNPISWQNGYSDSEVSDLIAGKFASKKTPPNIEQQQTLSSNDNRLKVQRHDLEEDSLCPICQEQMSVNEPISFCKKQCGNNFHIQCLKVWVQHKSDNVTCPMCRQQLGQNAWSELLREEQEYLSRKQTHKFQCKGCQIKPIQGGVYQCVICKNLVLCQKCFSKNTHSEHDYYFYKIQTDDEWKPMQRSKQQIGLWNANQVLKRISNLQQPLHNFLLECFKYFNQNQQKENSLLVVGSLFSRDKRKCSICNQLDFTEKNLGKSILVEMKCGHLIDQRCLMNLYENHFICPIDGVVQLEGYLKINGGNQPKVISKISVEVKEKGQLNMKPPHIDKHKGEVQFGFPLGFKDRERKGPGERIQQGRLQSLQQRQPDSQPNLFIGGLGRFNENHYEKNQVKKSFKIRHQNTKQLQNTQSQQYQGPMDELIKVQGMTGNLNKRNFSETKSRQTDQQQETELVNDSEDFVPYNQQN